MHENPNAPTTLQSYEARVLKNTSLWGDLLLYDFSLTWFVFVIATLEIVLPNHIWNIIISSKPYFVIIKIKINQTLVSQKCLFIFMFFVQLCYAGLCTILIIDFLSQQSLMGLFHLIFKSFKIFFNHSSSKTPWAIVRNFTFALDLATKLCFLLLHVTKFSPRKVQYLVVDLLSTIDP